MMNDIMTTISVWVMENVCTILAVGTLMVIAILGLNPIFLAIFYVAVEVAIAMSVKHIEKIMCAIEVEETN